MAFTPLQPGRDYRVRVRLFHRGVDLGIWRAIARIVEGEPQLVLNWGAKYLNAKFTPRFALPILPRDLIDLESELYDYEYTRFLEWPESAGPPPNPNEQGPVGP